MKHCLPFSDPGQHKVHLMPRVSGNKHRSVHDIIPYSRDFAKHFMSCQPASRLAAVQPFSYDTLHTLPPPYLHINQSL